MQRHIPHVMIIELARPSDGNGMPRIKQFNRTMAEFLGYSLEELIGKPVDIIATNHALWRIAVADAIDPLKSGPAMFNDEIVRKENRKLSAQISLSILSDPANASIDIAVLIQVQSEQDIDTEAALADSEQRFRQMAELAGEWLWEQTPDGYYSYSSAAVSQILGHRPDEVLGKHYTEFLTVQDKANQQRYVFSRRPFYGLLSHYRHKDGREVLTESTGLPIFGANGKLLKWRGVDRDITARMHFQDALVDSEKRLRLIIENSLSAIVIMDSYGIISDWNHPAEKMFGWSKEEAIGRRLEQLIIPLRLREAHRQGMECFLRTGSGPLLNRLIEQTGLRRDGSEFPVELSISPLKLGNAYIFSGFIHDITERKRLEHRFRQAVEAAPNAIVMINKSGIIEMVNSQTEASFGYSRTELLGQQVEILIPQRYREAHVRYRNAYLEAPVSRPMGMGRELYGLRKNGSEFPVEIGLSLIDSEQETLVLSTIVEISARKAAEQQIREAQVNLAIAQNEIKIAQQIQSSLSPSEPIKSKFFEVTGYCLPADQVGGDYFDYFYRNEQHLDMIIADVSGHSIGPALFMVETRSAIRTQAGGSATPAEALKILNNFLFEDLDKSDYFITLFYLQYDSDSHRLSYANAGHMPPLLLRNGDNECRKLDAEGLILGVNRNVVFEEKTVTLEAGDLVLLYTDGLTETENARGEFFGLERVSDILIKNAHRPPQAIIDALMEQLKQFCRCKSFEDDITLMIFKRNDRPD